MTLIDREHSGHRVSATVAEQRMRQWTLSLEVQQRRQEELPPAQLPNEIHPYVAISREAGTGGSDIARRVAEMLGWELLHREILDDMAERYKLPRDMLNFVDETTSNWVVEVFGKWIDQRVVTQSEYITHVGQLVLMAARHASTVFVGRGAQFLLPADRGLTIYLVAPLEMRIQRICEIRNCSAAEAREYIRETDKGRRDLVKKYFNHDIGDSHLYDLVINRSHVGMDEAAELIVDRYRRRFTDG